MKRSTLIAITLLVALLSILPKSAKAENSVLFQYNYQANESYGPNSENGHGAVLRYQSDLYADLLDWAVEYNRHFDKDFPEARDPKGSWGALTGDGVMGSLIFTPKGFFDGLNPYVIGSVGYFWWDFDENPFLQDNNVKVEVDNSLAYRIGAGIDIELSPQWGLNFEISYFTAQIDKYASDGMQEWHILDDNKIGNETWQYSAGLRYRF